MTDPARPSPSAARALRVLIANAAADQWGAHAMRDEG